MGVGAVDLLVGREGINPNRQTNVTKRRSRWLPRMSTVEQ